MAGVRQYGPVLHSLHMLFPDYMCAAGDGDKEVTVFRRLGHGGDFKAIHPGFSRLDGIDFTDRHFCTQAGGTHGDSFSAPSVADYYRPFTADDEVRSAHDAVPH